MITKKHMKWGLALLTASLLWTVPVYAAPAEGEYKETEFQAIDAEETADASQEAEADVYGYGFGSVAVVDDEKASAAGSGRALQTAQQQVVVDYATVPLEENADEADTAGDFDSDSAGASESVNDSVRPIHADDLSEEEVRTAQKENRETDAENSRISDGEYVMTEEKEWAESATTEDEVPTPSENNETIGQRIAAFALQFVGNPYVYGGSSLTRGTDCSGFVMSVYQNFGISLPHSSRSQRGIGADVGGIQNAVPGDIVCYSGHVGLYIGDGQIVHALNRRKGIVISPADFDRILAVRRVV